LTWPVALRGGVAGVYGVHLALPVPRTDSADEQLFAVICNRSTETRLAGALSVVAPFSWKNGLKIIKLNFAENSNFDLFLKLKLLLEKKQTKTLMDRAIYFHNGN